MNHVQALKADIATLTTRVVVKVDHHHRWSTAGKSLRVETTLEIKSTNKLIEPHLVRGAVGGVDTEETFIRILTSATQRCADFVKQSASRKNRTALKAIADLNAINRLMWKLAADDMISEIILRTCNAIDKDPAFSLKEMLKVVNLLKARTSQHVSNLFTEEAK
jgi:hypothetical protein